MHEKANITIELSKNVWRLFQDKQKEPSIRMVLLLAPQTGLEPVTPRLTAACSTDWAIKAYSVLIFGMNHGVCDTIGQKHCRIARLERFALLCVSSCSRRCFISHRERNALSQLTSLSSTDWAIKSKIKSVGVDLSSRAASSQVFSALLSLTTVFGMGTGVASSLWAPALFSFL